MPFCNERNSMSKTLKYGLIGFGGIAENRVAKEGFSMDRSRFQPLDGIELVKTCDLDPSRKNAAEILNIPFCNSFKDIIDDPEIDAVYVATNNRSHASLAEEALEAGKHVIIEKPMATNLADAEHLMKLAQDKGLSLTVDHMMVNNALHKKAKDLIQTGKIDKINDSCFHMEFAYGYTPEEAATWRCNKPEELGGPIGDVASHCFYMAEYLLDDEIAALGAVYIPKTLTIAVEDGAYIKFRMKGGQTGTIRVSFSDRRGGLGGTLSNLGFELYGESAVLRGYGTLFQLSGHKDEIFPIRLELDRFSTQDKIIVDNDDNINIYRQLIVKHADSIRNNTPLSPEDAVRNIKLCLAAHESAKNDGIFIKI